MGAQKTIFVVDDNDTNLAVAKEALDKSYRVLTLPSAAKMFALIDKVVPDLILLDIEMPDMDGFEALRRLKTDNLHENIPVIFLTSMRDAATEIRGFQLGVVDFVTKPFTAPVLLNRIKSHLQIDEIIRERTAQIQRLKNAIVLGFADVVEKRDSDTGNHVERTSEYIRVLVIAMKERGVHENMLSDIDIDSFSSSARLHDIGKIAIPDAILNKPAKLTNEEYTIMKTHAAEGERMIDRMAARTDDDVFLKNAKHFAGGHHEYWDGSGYPRSLKGAKIPIQGRIMALVDVYDALLSKRPYKERFTLDETLAIIRDKVGKQFDPYITDVFFEIQDKLSDVRKKYTDEETTPPASG